MSLHVAICPTQTQECNYPERHVGAITHLIVKVDKKPPMYRRG